MAHRSRCRYGDSMSDTVFVRREDGLRLATRFQPGTGPALVFLPGYMSDMTGSKATALFEWAGARGRACLLLDYSGCGESEGAFADGTLPIWRDDSLAAIAHHVPADAPVVLVGSSMGGWLMLLIALAMGPRVAGMVGIAAAPDFTEWGFSETDKATIRESGRLEEPSEYSDEPYLTTRAFWESGQANLLLAGDIAIDAPVRLLHGQQDADVPWEISLKLAAALRSSDVQTLLVKGGDHRLSRDQDIALLVRTVESLIASL